MFIPTICPKCPKELQPITKTTIPLAKHEAAKTTLVPAEQLSMWGHRTIHTTKKHRAKCCGQRFSGISTYFTNVSGVVRMRKEEVR